MLRKRPVDESVYSEHVEDSIYQSIDFKKVKNNGDVETRALKANFEMKKNIF